MNDFCAEEAQQLLHNKFVVVMGDSIQRSVYKDLVKLLQNDKYLTEGQLKRKGEKTFENDTLVEGGVLKEMHNGVDYREVRQYRSGHHLVRFYFLTRVYSAYLESVLSDFQAGPAPDVLIINSCFWDLTRYSFSQMDDYLSNLQTLFSRLNEVLSAECLVLWNMTMPVGYRDSEFPQYLKHNLRWNIVEGNYYSATLADAYKMDVLDMHYHFRRDLQRRCRDAIHWDQLAHRKYTQILLAHVAQAWGVQPPQRKRAAVNGYNDQTVPTRVVRWQENGGCPDLQHRFQERAVWGPDPSGFGLPSCAAGAYGAFFVVVGDAFLLNVSNVRTPMFGCENVLGLSADEPPRFVLPSPGYTSFDVNHNAFQAIPPQPGVYCQGYTGFEEKHGGRLDDSFVSDSPLLVAGIMPGYLSFDGNRPNNKARHRGSHPFSAMNMAMNVVPNPNFQNTSFGSFPPHLPHAPLGFRPHRFTMKRQVRPDSGWFNPYHRPPLPPTWIY
ncbi:LOW QUALITY PROTEIN: PC-esterase domain-containing protein 1A-like [Spea bombifrons]|uniref:LOW QUALITY PROTEIN: PC-esterase domain-containing protein 1A-like n=1 Tax=Spea bombifrons TaxID=233779 RepID=UPI0023490AF9|nr:LOW QUALITY PROTEIN: PC-esterase domain-containing protein 1A-like [Spea bombifrons]